MTERELVYETMQQLLPDNGQPKPLTRQERNLQKRINSIRGRALLLVYVEGGVAVTVEVIDTKRELL